MAKDGEPLNLNRAHWLCILFGHSFRPRYDHRQERKPHMEGCALESETLAAIEASVAKTYRGDVCERCGSIAQQESETSQ